MSTSMIIALLAVAVAIFTALYAAWNSGPKVTTIETKHERDDGDKDGDDA